jgi:hypothetical protein
MFSVQHDDVRLARRVHRRTVQHKVPHFGFLWLSKGNLGKAGIRFKIGRGFDNVDSLLNFVSR